MLVQNCLCFFRKVAWPLVRRELAELANLVVDKESKQILVLAKVGPVVFFRNAAVFSSGERKQKFDFSLHFWAGRTTVQFVPTLLAGGWNILQRNDSKLWAREAQIQRRWEEGNTRRMANKKDGKIFEVNLGTSARKVWYGENEYRPVAFLKITPCQQYPVEQKRRDRIRS